MDAIIAATGGELVEVTVHNPIGELIKSSYGIIPHTKTAIIEMSAAAGITLIDEKDRNPLNTTTYGVGELIADAIAKGCRKFVVGIGGSATNDGGIGMLQALGFAFLSYLDAALQSGIGLVIKETNLEEHVKDADVVVTGEGRLDGQSYMGKAPIGVAKLAKKYHKPVVAFSGCVTDDAVNCNEHGIDAVFPILRTPCTLQEAMDCKQVYENLKATAQQVFRLIKTYI